MHLRRKPLLGDLAEQHRAPLRVVPGVACDVGLDHREPFGGGGLRCERARSVAIEIGLGIAEACLPTAGREFADRAEAATAAHRSSPLLSRRASRSTSMPTMRPIDTC